MRPKPEWAQTPESLMGRWNGRYGERDRYVAIATDFVYGRPFGWSDRVCRLLAVGFARIVGFNPDGARAIESIEDFADEKIKKPNYYESMTNFYCSVACGDFAYITCYMTVERQPRGAELTSELIVNVVAPGWELGDWRTATVVNLANHIYSSKEWSLMPILADALQDAGCDNDWWLERMRKSDSWCRGCLIMDQLIGK